MPPRPPVVGALEMVHKFDVGIDTDVITRQHYSYSTAPPTVPQVTAIATSVRNAFTNRLASHMCNTYSMVETTVTDLSSDLGSQGIDGTAVPGTSNNVNLSASAATIEQRKNPRRFRGGHYRTYWPLGTQLDLASPQTWLGAYVTATAAAFAAYENDVVIGVTNALGGLSLSIGISYFSGFLVIINPITHRARNVPQLRTAGAPPVPTPLVDHIVAIATNPKVGSQRRRNLQSA